MLILNTGQYLMTQWTLYRNYSIKRRPRLSAAPFTEICNKRRTRIIWRLVLTFFIFIDSEGMDLP